MLVLALNVLNCNRHFAAKQASTDAFGCSIGIAVRKRREAAGAMQAHTLHVHASHRASLHPPCADVCGAGAVAGGALVAARRRLRPVRRHRQLAVCVPQAPAARAAPPRHHPSLHVGVGLPLPLRSEPMPRGWFARPGMLRRTAKLRQCIQLSASACANWRSPCTPLRLAGTCFTT